MVPAGSGGHAPARAMGLRPILVRAPGLNPLPAGSGLGTAVPAASGLLCPKGIQNKDQALGKNSGRATGSGTCDLSKTAGVESPAYRRWLPRLRDFGLARRTNATVAHPAGCADLGRLDRASEVPLRKDKIPGNHLGKLPRHAAALLGQAQIEGVRQLSAVHCRRPGGITLMRHKHDERHRGHPGRLENPQHLSARTDRAR
jgi:hypothetical protein